jgi:hypothetical protein
MKTFLASLVLCSALAFGQGGIIGGSGVIGHNGVIGYTVPTTPTVTKIGQLNFATASPYTLTVTGNAAIGDTVLLMCAGQGANAGTHYTFSVSDSVGNTWTYPTLSTNTTLQFLDTANGEAIQVPFAATIATGYVASTTTLTVTDAVSDGSTGGCDLFDITHLVSTPFDNSVGTTAGVSTTFVTGTYTPSTQPEVVIAIWSGITNFFSAYGNIIGSAATGLDHRTGGTGSANQSDIAIEWRRVTATTAGTGSITQAASTDGNGTIIMGFKSN